MTIGYDGRSIANFVLDFCERNGRTVTNLSLQKIVYFCHVWSLIELGKPLIRHKFEAWEYGPVLPYLYREFKGFDRSPISIWRLCPIEICGFGPAAERRFFF